MISAISSILILLQVKSSLAEADDKMIKDVLTANKNLKNLIEEYLSQVTHPDTDGLESLTVFNICKVMEDTMHTLIGDLQTQACAIERLYANQPSLTVFDQLTLQFCGLSSCALVSVRKIYL